MTLTIVSVFQINGESSQFLGKLPDISEFDFAWAGFPFSSKVKNNRSSWSVSVGGDEISL